MANLIKLKEWAREEAYNAICDLERSKTFKDKDGVNQTYLENESFCLSLDGHVSVKEIKDNGGYYVPPSRYLIAEVDVKVRVYDEDEKLVLEFPIEDEIGI